MFMFGERGGEGDCISWDISIIYYTAARAKRSKRYYLFVFPVLFSFLRWSLCR
jgi:hypothetical protein